MLLLLLFLYSFIYLWVHVRAALLPLYPAVSANKFGLDWIEFAFVWVVTTTHLGLNVKIISQGYGHGLG